MRLAALILVHRYPEQAAELISTLLSHPQVQVIVHVDAKAQSCFETLQSQFKENSRVEFIKPRYKVFWGSYQQIQATYALLQAAEKSKSDYAVLLSGQDFPIKPISEFIDFLKSANYKNFVVNFALPDRQWEGGGLQRLQYFHFDSEKHPWLIRKFTAVIHRVQNLLGYKRSISEGLYGGSNWFNLNAHAIKAVCNYVESNRHFLKQFKYSRCADEIFLQSVLARVTDISTFENADLRMIDWSSGPEFPHIWRGEDYERLVSAEHKFFARKFDASIDQEILTKLRAYVAR